MATSDQLQRLVEEARIAELLHRYCAFCDSNDPVGVAGCFTEDCIAFYGPGEAVRGKEPRRETAERDLALFEATSHHLSNITATFDTADRARVSSYIYAWHRPRVGGPDWELWGRYEDVVVLTGAGWLIAERRLLVSGVSGFPEHWQWLRPPRHELTRGGP
jgi:ketosteroid isomerase-like protein